MASFRITRAIVSALLVLALLVWSAVPALAGGKPTVEPVGFPPEGIELPAGAFCDFDLFVEALRNTEMIKTFPPYEDGSFLQIVTGQLWIRVTNVDTDASVDLKISGPVRYVVAPDGTTTATFFGRSLPIQPGQFLVTSGRIVQVVHPDGSTDLLPASGHSIDVCSLLEPA